MCVQEEKEGKYFVPGTCTTAVVQVPALGGYRSFLLVYIVCSVVLCILLITPGKYGTTVMKVTVMQYLL